MRTSKRILIIATALTLVIVSATNSRLSACTSFQLKSENDIVIAHSLNFGIVPSVPGAIYINQRDVYKTGYSWESLIQVNDDPPPNLIWKSKYGSVTFNTFGRELPDGGVNEAGLSIWEMGFDTRYPDDATKPKLFQCQWMQYVLDNHSTVDEVLDNADRMAIDGWGWHYFVGDKSGKTAIIDFVDGKPVVYSGSSLPLPLCCNSPYSDAMKWLSQHEGFGGELEIKQIFEEIPRFVYGAKLLQDFDQQNPVEYSFQILDDVSVNVRWSIVCDLNNMTVYWSTNLNKEIRYFSLTPDDFAHSDGPLMLDIEYPGPGDVKGEFVSYTDDANLALLRTVFERLFELSPGLKKATLDSQGADLDGFVRAITERVRDSDHTADHDILGNWTGGYSVTANDSLIDVPMTLKLFGNDDNLTGTLGDELSGIELPISNLSYNGGLLQFTVWNPETDDLSLYQLYLTAGQINGSAQLWTSNKQATVSLTR